MIDEQNTGDPLEPRLPPQEPVAPQKARLSRSAEMRANVKIVFGSGAGRIALIAGVVITIVFISLSIRGLSGKNNNNAANVEVSQAKAPVVKPTNAPVTEKEAERQNAFSNKQAEIAKENGRSYQPPFQTNIISQDKSSQMDVSTEQPSIFSDQQLKQLKLEEQSTDKTEATSQNNAANQQTTNDTENKSYQLTPEEYKRLNEQYNKEKKNRDDYVNKLTADTINQIKDIMGNDKADPSSNLGTYATLNYPSPTKSAGTAATKSSNPGATTGNAMSNNKKVLIKTGNILYATLTSIANTDEGEELTAEIRGGEWDKSVLIGKIVKTQSNINFIFTTLAPQDKIRPVLKINAMGLKQSDGSRGMAEDIDRHILERYGSLFAASVASGYGQAYQNIGTTTSSSTTTTQTKTEPSSKEILANAVGEVGENIASVVKKNFDRPTTYSTPNNTGFALFFLSDVVESN